MDEQASTSTGVKALVAFGACLLLLVPVRSAFGDRGVEVVLALALVALAVYAYEQLTGRPLPRPRLWGPGREAAPAPVVEDAWRSERWVREAVERGLRALDEWRWEQREA